MAVTLKFDPTCPMRVVRQVMKAEIPVWNLFLDTHCIVYPELDLAVSLYASGLRKVVIQSPPSFELEDVLIRLVSSCPQLCSLHVMSLLPSSLIRQIHQLNPKSRSDDGNWTLKSEIGNCPWITSSAYDKVFMASS